jgi:hypothetical protein
MYKILVVITLSFLGLKLGCHRQKPSKPDHTLLACVHHQCLYKEDLEGIIPANDSTGKDSPLLVEQYVKTWATNQLLAQQAEKQITGAQREQIEKKVADFRSTLLGHLYLENLVEEKVKRDITDQEIQAYYQAYQDNFKLKHSIFKGKLIVVPKNAPQVARLKQLMPLDTTEALKELKEYCAAYATYSSLDNQDWLSWDGVIPPSLASNMLSQALGQTKSSKKPSLKEMQDATYRYYLRIDAYKPTNDIAPIEFVKDQIAKVILYKRKIQLATQVREDILQQAKNNNVCTIYESKN